MQILRTCKDQWEHQKQSNGGGSECLHIGFDKSAPTKDDFGGEEPGFYRANREMMTSVPAEAALLLLVGTFFHLESNIKSNFRQFALFPIDNQASLPC